MAERVTLSGQNLELAAIVAQRTDVRAGLHLHHSTVNPAFTARFAGNSVAEVSRELSTRLDEVDRQAILNVLAALEATFRIDYLTRCYRRERDPLSRTFRDIHQVKGAHVSFERDLLDAWKKNTLGSTRIIGDLKTAFGLRHWLAHGRWWTPKLGRVHDFYSIETLADEVLNSFPFLS